MIGNPKRDSALGIAEIHSQTRLDATDHGECARPVLVNEFFRRFRDVHSKRSNQGRLADEYRRRHVAATVLGVEQPLHRLGAERVSANPVDGVGREHDAFASLDGLAGSLGRLGIARRIISRAVEPPIRHRALGLRRLSAVGFAGHGGRGHRSILPESPADSRCNDKITEYDAGP